MVTPNQQEKCWEINSTYLAYIEYTRERENRVITNHQKLNAAQVKQDKWKPKEREHIFFGSGFIIFTNTWDKPHEQENNKDHNNLHKYLKTKIKSRLSKLIYLTLGFIVSTVRGVEAIEPEQQLDEWQKKKEIFGQEVGRYDTERGQLVDAANRNRSVEKGKNGNA